MNLSTWRRSLIGWWINSDVFRVCVSCWVPHSVFVCVDTQRAEHCRCSAPEHVVGPAGSGGAAGQRKEMMSCWALLSFWLLHCVEGLPTGWGLMGLAPHRLIHPPHRTENCPFKMDPQYNCFSFSLVLRVNLPLSLKFMIFKLSSLFFNMKITRFTLNILVDWKL